MEESSASDPQVTIEISKHSPVQRHFFRNTIANYNGSAQLSVPEPDGFPVWRVVITFSKYDAVSGFFSAAWKLPTYIFRTGQPSAGVWKAVVQGTK